MRTAASLIAVIVHAAPVMADICVTNAGDQRMLFAAETDDGERIVGWLEPGGRLCAPGDGAGRVSVFESEDTLEGCTRLVAPGGSDTLLRYVAFDRCLWQSHVD
ncbi:hypothetical protein DEA8626_01174 [Defluviimonas aquaemixtae]|uniref:Uncharacterized protein n=1 Tax=Albidovulum aquaemixtae TaxID=1542388 RepID=A0A2R8B532_9RHOB|nr:hypothetical protein [Defluviimonas aquaemixtae]SPH17650.1 hypothetical protein DEA8626_01174 [Defluviimonas aquaemixtae]